jgi:hypothetical protein
MVMPFPMFLGHATGFDPDIRRALGKTGILTGNKRHISFIKDMYTHQLVSEGSKLKNYIKGTKVKSTNRVK